jgi:hypothetical protein
LLSYAIEYLKEEIDLTTKSDGTIVKTTYGVQRIPDVMLLKEMLSYHPGLNVDRLVAFSALIAFAKVQQSNRGYAKRKESTVINLDKSDNLYKLNSSPFRHIGGNKGSSSSQRLPRIPYRRLK